MRVIPLGERVLLRPLGLEERTPSGLFLPETAQPEFVEYEVSDLGYQLDSDVPLRSGDRVILHKAVGSRIDVGGQTWVVVLLNQILARLVAE